MAFGPFGNNNNPPAPPAGNGSNNNPPAPPAGEDKGETGNGKKYRAKADCIFNGAYVAQGEIVSGDAGKNPNFEPV